MSVEKSNHYLAYAFPFEPTLQGQLDGGLPNAILRQIQFREHEQQSLTIISPDQTSLSHPEYAIQINPAEPETELNNDRYGFWFGDMWVVLHPDAHIRDTYPADVLAKMFPHEQHKETIGTLERAIEHVETFGFMSNNPQVEAIFSSRFDAPISKIPDNSVINWQDYMFSTTIRKHAASLRQRGCFQTFHLHTTLPKELYRFSQGVSLLEAMSAVDRVYVHTDEYGVRLEEQLILLGLPIPDIRRFDLGIDAISIQKRLHELTPDTYTESTVYKNFPKEQQEVIDEIIKTQNRDDLHRFIDIDRADQGKGQTVVLDAMDEYLSQLSEEERKKYKFYFIMPQLDWPVVENHPQRQYIDHLRQKAATLKEKYPDILYYTHGVPPAFISLVVRNAHTITGGIQDGLCLSPQEVLKVNALLGKNRSGIIGMGTGFAMQTLKTYEAQSKLVQFVRQGRSEDIIQAIRGIVQKENEDAQVLKNQTAQFVEEVIDKRTDGVVVYP